MRHVLDQTQTALSSPSRNLIAILGFVITVAIVSTIAYMAAGWSFVDASYMVLITIYTVGYGEIRPIDTTYLHAVTITTMVLGCTGMILLTGALVQFLTIIQIREVLGSNRMTSRIAKMSDHVIVCGYGRIGVMLAAELRRAGVPLIVIERGEARLAEAEAAGHCTLAGDATEDAMLRNAGIERARALASVLPDDAANVFITLSARSLNPGLEIIARGEATSTELKLINAGANHVIFPTHIGAERIARTILYPASEAIEDDQRLADAKRELEILGLELELVEAVAGASAVGLTVEQAERRANGTLFIVQIEHADGTRHLRPARDEPIEAGDRMLVVFRDASRAARALFMTREEVRAGRNVF